jgi:hypothetical protein
VDIPRSTRMREVFYGRERLAAELAVKLAGRAVGGRLVVVTGRGAEHRLRAGRAMVPQTG